MKKKAKKGSEPAVKKRKKMALGRGLDALIPDIESIRDVPREFFNCDIGMIRPNRYQPRRRFSEEELRELSHSIKMQGVIQPLLVRKDTSGYELVTGERRLRAAKLAGLKQVPVVLKEVTDSKLLEISIIVWWYQKDSP
jgi:ParB family chromosome partitioning protein